MNIHAPTAAEPDAGPDLDGMDGPKMDRFMREIERGIIEVSEKVNRGRLPRVRGDSNFAHRFFARPC